ncbi:MAG: cyclase family protein [Cyclobacteriaceae bacterium]
MKLIDLSLTVNNKMPGVDIQSAKKLGVEGWNASTLQLYSHSGTHVDAPVHFGVSDIGLDQMTLDQFSAEAWLVDCTDIAGAELITIDHLGSIANKVQPGDGLVFKTNWSDKFGTPDYREKLPRISEELARWIVAKKVKLIGVEPQSVADVNNLPEVTKIHEILLGGGVTIVEGLTNLNEITQDKFQILALPLKIEGGDGCPVRAVAIV